MSKGPLNTSTWKDKIRLGVYSSHIVDELDEQQVIDLVDAGIEVSILGFDRFIPHEQRMWLLDLYEKHGAYMLLYDRNIMSPMEVLGKSGAMLFDKEKAAEADWYKDHPAFAGNSFVDEPEPCILRSSDRRWRTTRPSSLTRFPTSTFCPCMPITAS
jgi:hypothetical protein